MVVKDFGFKGSFFDKNETLEREVREKVLFKNFSQRIKNIVDVSKGWNNILSGIDLSKINSREDLIQLPITKKSSFPLLQKNAFPFGNLNTKPYNQFPFMFASPGPIYEPGNKNDFWNMSRSLYAAGLREKDIAYNTFSYHLGPAGIMMQQACNNIGCTVIPGGIGNTELQLETIKNLRPSFYLGTPSFLKILLEKSKEKKIDISSLKKGLVGAEPFPPPLREKLAEEGVDVVQMYGIAEIGCIAYETKDSRNNLTEGMLIEEDVILEIVRPGTSKSLPPGEVGEIVVTKINSDYPMIRLGTGDLSKIIIDPSPCGRTNFRIHGWMGRADQSTKFKGIFVTPDQINKITDSFKEISKVKFVINTKELLDNGELFCETNIHDVELQNKVKEFFKSNFKLNINVSLVKKGDILNDGLVIQDKRVLN
ncbi:MAG: phenylacetate--CoA ligase family protein [Alphaproteobacteria bacterium TMED93]|nr:MAG: phenylacetate--CoA ligase family protein [Alphaproteobacteria bacterium TMED93]